MKKLTKIIASVTGVITSLFTMACERQAPRVYGPAPVEDVNQRHATSPAPENNMDLPESDNEAMGDIYGPPSMFGQEEPAIPEAENAKDANDSNRLSQPKPQNRKEPPAPVYGMTPR